MSLRVLLASMFKYLTTSEKFLPFEINRSKSMFTGRAAQQAGQKPLVFLRNDVGRGFGLLAGFSIFLCEWASAGDPNPGTCWAGGRGQGAGSGQEGTGALSYQPFSGPHCAMKSVTEFCLNGSAGHIGEGPLGQALQASPGCSPLCCFQGPSLAAPGHGQSPPELGTLGADSLLDMGPRWGHLVHLHQPETVWLEPPQTQGRTPQQ